MNKKHLVTYGTVALAGIASANGAATTYGNVLSDFTNSTVINTSGVPVAAGTGYLGVGMFAGLDDAAIAALGSAGLAAAFTAYASTTFGTANVGDSEGIALGTTAGAPGDVIPDSFNGQSVYFLLGDQSGFAGSGQYAVVKDGANTFPDDDPTSPAPLAVDWSIQDVTEADVIIGTFVEPGVSSATLVGVGGSAARASVQLIPEPSAFIFSLAGLALIFRRRR